MIEIDLNVIIEFILCVLNDLDDVCIFFFVVGDKVDEVFIGFCMTNIGYFRVVVKFLNDNFS